MRAAATRRWPERAGLALEFPAAPDGRTGWPWSVASGPVSEAPPAGDSWPRITIVTPSFNHGPYLEAALRSVLAQRYPNLELIVVDGGSTDGTHDTLRRYAPWIDRSISERDSGPGHALNKGFALATGDILGFLNADDFHLPGALAAVARAFAIRPSADVISGHGYFATASGAIGAPIFSDTWHASRFAYGACVLVQPATFFRRRILDRTRGVSERTRTAWDQELWADMALAGAVFDQTPEFLAAFRLHDGSITGSAALRAQRRIDARAVLEKVRGRAETPRDRLIRLAARLRKFVRHPRRTIRQRAFVLGTLKRWAL